MNLKEELLRIINGFHGNAYYTAGNISQKRLQAAVGSHGVDPRDEVLAVLDATILGHTRGGSADNGMSITLRGIHWKNGWAVATRKNSYTWEELARLADALEVKGDHVQFELGVEFSTLGSLKAQQLVHLLQAICRFFVECQDLAATAAAANGTVTGTAPADPPPARPALPELPPPGDAEAFGAALVNVLALAVCHSGEPEGGCLDLAIEFLRSEESLPDAAGALDRLSAAIEQLSTDAAKGPAFFKIRQSKLVAELRPVEDPHRRAQLDIMLEALHETAPEDGREKLADVSRKVAAALSPK